MLAVEFKLTETGQGSSNFLFPLCRSSNKSCIYILESTANEGLINPQISLQSRFHGVRKTGEGKISITTLKIHSRKLSRLRFFPNFSPIRRITKWISIKTNEKISFQFTRSIFETQLQIIPRMNYSTHSFNANSYPSVSKQMFGHLARA